MSFVEKENQQVAYLLDNVLAQTNIGRRLQRIERFLFDDVLAQLKGEEKTKLYGGEYDRTKDVEEWWHTSDIYYGGPSSQINLNKKLSDNDLKYKQYYVYNCLKGDLQQYTKTLNFLGYYAAIYYETVTGQCDELLVTDYFG